MDATTRPEPQRHRIQSVDRALFLLETIDEAGGEVSLTELATRTGLNISTCHHLLATLIERGFAAKVPGRRFYALGSRVAALGYASLQVGLPRRAQPYLDAISRTTGETVYLAVLQSKGVVTAAMREAKDAAPLPRGTVGKPVVPYATSAGKAIMAWLPEHEIRRLLSGGMPRFTANTITEVPDLLELLRVVRRNGYAIDREEYRPGVVCVGAAIRDKAGTVIGAISASAPAGRASETHVGLMREQISAATRALSVEFAASPGSSRSEAAIFAQNQAES